MIEKGLIITGSDAELLSRALSEVKTKAYEESEAQLDDTQALNALVSGFRIAENEGQEKERHHSYFSPLRKRLVLGTIIDMKGGRLNEFTSDEGYSGYSSPHANIWTSGFLPVNSRGANLIENKRYDNARG